VLSVLAVFLPALGLRLGAAVALLRL